MKAKYKFYPKSEITKNLLDSIEIGDYIKCNNWKTPMIVVAMSKNYFIMIKNHFGSWAYSICEKLPAKSTYNNMNEGEFTIGPDNCYGAYDYIKLEECEEALVRLEDGYTYTGIADKNEHPNYYDWEKTANPITLKLGHIELGRHAISLNSVAIKKTKWSKDNIQEYLDKYF